MTALGPCQITEVRAKDQDEIKLKCEENYGGWRLVASVENYKSQTKGQGDIRHNGPEIGRLTGL